MYSLRGRGMHKLLAFWSEQERRYLAELQWYFLKKERVLTNLNLALGCRYFGRSDSYCGVAGLAPTWSRLGAAA